MTNARWLPDFHQRPKVSRDSAGENAMSRLELAADRLRHALDALEKFTVPPVGMGEEQALREKIAVLEAEREQLLTKIAGLEDEVAALSSVTGEIEERLDGAIGEIRAALAR
jgi:hypothetical protein